MASLPKKSDGLDGNVEIRGVGEHAWELRPNVKMIEGRKFQPGLRELITGKSAKGQFSNLDVGSSLKLNGQLWTIVGVFDSGDSHNSELWGDTGVVGSTYRRGASTSSVSMRLTSADAFEALKAASDDRSADQGRRQYHALRTTTSSPRASRRPSAFWASLSG